MEDKDKIIISLREQLSQALKTINALEQENALLNFKLKNNSILFDNNASVVHSVAPKRKTH